MTKPWTVLVAGLFGLFAVALGVKHFRSADPVESNPLSRRIEPFAGTSGAEASGWSAREGGAAVGGSGGASAGRRFASAGVERGAARNRGVGQEGDTSSWRVGEGRGATLGGVGVGRYPSGAIRAEAGVSALAVPFAGAKSSRDLQGRAGGRDAGGQLAGQSDKSGDDKGDAGPVLSVSFKDSTQPEQGASGPVIEENVSCDEGQGCTFDSNSQFAIPEAGNLTGEDGGSISLCLQPQWNGNENIDANLVDLHVPNTWENHLRLFKNGDSLRFILWPNSGQETGVAMKIANWQALQGHALTATFGPDANAGTNMISLYADGTLVGQQAYEGEFDVPRGQPLYIGSDAPGGEPGAGATLSNFQAYNRVLPPDEVANLAAGCFQ
jgi:hypothetical protein